MILLLKEDQIQEKSWKELNFIKGDSNEVIEKLPDDFYSCCVTRCPYWSKRDYGYLGQIGAEHELDEYIYNIVKIFRNIKNKL